LTGGSGQVPQAIRDVEASHIRARIRRLLVDYSALKVAIEDEFGADFDSDAWRHAFDSDDPADVNRVAPVVSGFERIVNGLVEAARSGLIASGVASPVRTPESVGADLELVRDDGGLTQGQAALLVDLSRTRNQLQHTYIELSADDVRAAISRLRANLPAIVKALNGWFTRHGVGV
jgi:uncharacterized protein YutE (UPF0331/DUF86 family)